MSVVEQITRCRPWIEAALEYSGGTHDFGDVADAILTGRMQLWANERGCAITEIVIYPKKKVLHVFLAGGDMDQITGMIEAGAEWGKAHGCTGMSMAGRKGWERVLARHGWRPVMSIMERDV